MGWHRHHAIVVTSFNQDSIEWAHEKACEIFCANEPEEYDPRGGRVTPVTEITDKVVNGYRSFMVAPDGSKEGWSESDRADDARESFIDWLEETRYDDGSSLLCWVEVEFSNEFEDYGAKIISSNEIPAGFEE